MGHGKTPGWKLMKKQRKEGTWNNKKLDKFLKEKKEKNELNE